MITTVTTTTVTTVSALGLAAALGVVATVALIALLIAKELASAARGERTIRWTRTLNIGIAPLVLTFAAIAVVRIAHAL